MSRELFLHQREALEKLPPKGGYLAFEQGLGKTLTAITYAEQHNFARVLVVCPAVAIGVWEDELEDRPVTVPTGTRKEKAQQIEGGWIILNYEALLEPELEKAVAKWDPDLIIIDEAQKIKSATAKRSKVLHRLGKTRAVLALSGTPITKNLLDLYSQYKAIDPDLWDGQSWTRFKQHYAVWGGYGGYELISYQNTDKLKAKIAPLTVVARKEDTLDLPRKTFQRIPVPLTGTDYSDYRTMATTGVLGEWVTTTPLEKALRLSQISGRAKVGATVQFVQDLLEAGEQVVVYFRFRDEGDALARALGVPQLTGDTPVGDRRRMVDAFQNGDSAIFLSQITAGSTAITLTAASHMVYHSLSYAYEDWAQSQDRIHRIGQDYPCNYYYMTAVGPKSGITIDQLVLDSLQRKEDVASLITADPDLLLKGLE